MPYGFGYRWLKQHRLWKCFGGLRAMKQGVCTEGRLPLSSRKGGGAGKRWRSLRSWQQEVLRFSGSTLRPFCSSMTRMPVRWRSSAALIVGKVGRSRGRESAFLRAGQSGVQGWETRGSRDRVVPSEGKLGLPPRSPWTQDRVPACGAGARSRRTRMSGQESP